MRVIVTGGRAYQFREVVNRALDRVKAKYPDLVIVHGDCPTGADRYAQEWCEATETEFKKFPANWKLGPKSGPLRNSAMIDAGADAVIAFPGGTGTADCVRKARVNGIPVWDIL